MTVNGIEINLDITPYSFDVDYRREKDISLFTYSWVRYKFSSKKYLINFENRIEQNRINVADKFYKRYGIVLDCTLLADLQLYKSIEKRGYQVVVNGEVCRWQENLILSGNKLTVKE